MNAFVLLALICSTAAHGRVQAASQTQPLTWIFLISGVSRGDVSKEKLDEMQGRHIANLKRLGDEGLALMAGPLGEDKESIRGIVLLKRQTQDELTADFKPDPYVGGGYMTIDSFSIDADASHIYKPGPKFELAKHTLVLLRRGPKGGKHAFVSSLKKWMQAGDLAFGGRFPDGKLLTGVLLFKTDDQAAVKSMLFSDRAVQKGEVIGDIHSQYLLKGVLERT